MKISLSTNFDNKLINQVKDYPIYEVYGKLNEDIIGGGRPSNTLNKLEKERFENHVKYVRENNINFNYLLNSACIENNNQDSEWVNNVIEFLKYLKIVGVNALTICNPYLAELVKKYFKNDFIIRISSFACIDSYEKAKVWDDLGVDIICVDFWKVNRNFEMLKYMVENLNCKLEVLCTNSCLKECPYVHTHINDIAHSSKISAKNKEYMDWGLNYCQKYQINNIHEYIKSPWIRPEDIKYYEKIGIEHFKITERDFPTNVLVNRVKAYCEEKYDGDLLDLIQGSGLVENLSNEKILKKDFKTLLEVNEEIKRVRGIGRNRELKRHIYIDNTKIPKKFIEFFVKGNCKGQCDKCNYCKNISNSAIKENKEVIDYLKYLYQKFDELKFKNHIIK